MQMRKLKIFTVATILSVATMGTTVFAGSQLYYSEEERYIVQILRLEVILTIIIPVFREERFGLHGEMGKHLELIMTILPKNIDAQLKMVMV